ncbi:MAG: DUF3408 domain-containing protein [Prevotella sp.]|nr:DUF3408 domain-containing protein [Prevotella sp.]
MTALQIILLLILYAIVTAETYLLWKGQKNKSRVQVLPGEHPYNAVKADDDERFHLAPLGNLDEEYINLFSNPPMDKAARRGKSAYLRDAYHDRIRSIVNALNIEDVNISSYVDMVLTDHFMRYEAQIDRLLQNSFNDTRKKRDKWQPS